MNYLQHAEALVRMGMSSRYLHPDLLGQIYEWQERERLTIQLRQLGWIPPRHCSTERLRDMLDRALAGEVQKPAVAT